MDRDRDRHMEVGSSRSKLLSTTSPLFTATTGKDLASPNRLRPSIRPSMIVRCLDLYGLCKVSAAGYAVPLA